MATAEVKPFAPPRQKDIDENLRPEDFEAKDTAEKLKREKLPKPIGFTVNHEIVGPWPKGHKVSVNEVHAHLSDEYRRIESKPEREEHIERLVGLNALVPFFE